MSTSRNEDDGEYSVSSNEFHVSLEDLLPLQETPEPGEDYCGPVSTPAFFLNTVDALKKDAKSGRYHDRDANVTYDKSYRQPEINYPNCLSKSSVTQTNLDYYYVPKTFGSNHSSPRWLNPLASQPYDELYSEYVRKLNASKGRPMDKYASRNPTPGERALVRGWENNSVKAYDDIHFTEQQKKPMFRTESSVTHAFPPSRVLITRSRTLGSDEFAQNRYPDSRHSAKTKWSRGSEITKRRPHVSQEVKEYQKVTPNGFVTEEYLSERKETHKKRKNYLNFMTRATCPSKQFGKPHRDKTTTLPAIHVRPTVLSELRKTQYNGKHGHTSDSEQNGMPTGSRETSERDFEKQIKVKRWRLPKRLYDQTICVPSASI